MEARNEAQTAHIVATAELIRARAELIGEIRRGLAKANERSTSESSESYVERVGALESLYRVVVGEGG